MTLRACVLGVVVMLGCKGADHGMEKSAGGDSRKETPAATPAADSAAKKGAAPSAAANLPSVSKRASIVDDPRPYAIGALVWIDDKGHYTTAKAGDDWRKAPAVRTPVPNTDELNKVLGVIKDPGGSSADDPPPPEEPDDESGGTGTAMVLEEGKMGKKDSERAAGSYRMARRAIDPYEEGVGDSRHAVGARAVPVAKLVEEPTVFASPAAPAQAVVRVLAATGGSLAVAHEDKIGVFPIGFTRRLGHGDPSAWVELHVTGDAVRFLESVKVGELGAEAIAHAAGVVDGTALVAALGKAKVAAETQVDILVADGSTAQQLLAVLVALDGIPMRRIGLGLLRDTPRNRELEVATSGRKLKIPSVAIGSATSAGDLDKAIIRRYIRRNLAKISYCYEKELIAKPKLSGTVASQFMIGPDGKVVTADANGVDPAVASCVAGVIKLIEFPRPKTGSVQVNYPFIFRPANE